MSTYPVSAMEADEPELPPGPEMRSPFLPMLLFVIAFLAWTVFQTTQLIGDRSTLAQARSMQTSSLAQAQKIRTATDSLARKTQALADAGNANAQLVIAELRQRGVTINPSASAAMPPQ